MKKIFITVSEGSVARNILRSFVLEDLLKNSDAEIHILCYQEKEDVYKKDFGSERVKIFAFQHRSQKFLDKLIIFLARNGLATETVMTDQRTYLLQSKRYPVFFLKRLIGYVFGRLRIFHALIRFLAGLRPPEKDLLEFFEKVKPDLLFSTDVQDELDIDAMRVARRYGIKVISMVRSWDNLTSHYLIPVMPDILVVWSPYIKDKAVRLHHVSEKRIVMTGIPHYDWYMRPEILKTREEFLRPYGISPQNKLILFAGIGKDLAPHETEVAESLDKAINKGEIKENVSVIFRPHPSFLVDREHIKTLSHTAFDDTVASYTGMDKSSWEMDRDKISHLINSLYHADLVITTASTITMDAVSFDKPVICIGFDGKSREPYWNSVARYYKDYTHYKFITATGGFKLVKSGDELVRAVNEYLKNPSLDADGRERIRNEFIWKLDGKSAERLSGLILKNLK